MLHTDHIFLRQIRGMNIFRYNEMVSIDCYELPVFAVLYSETIVLCFYFSDKINMSAPVAMKLPVAIKLPAATAYPSFALSTYKHPI